MERNKRSIFVGNIFVVLALSFVLSSCAVTNTTVRGNTNYSNSALVEKLSRYGLNTKPFFGSSRDGDATALYKIYSNGVWDTYDYLPQKKGVLMKIVGTQGSAYGDLYLEIEFLEPWSKYPAGERFFSSYKKLSELGGTAMDYSTGGVRFTAFHQTQGGLRLRIAMRPYPKTVGIGRRATATGKLYIFDHSGNIIFSRSKTAHGSGRGGAPRQWAESNYYISAANALRIKYVVFSGNSTGSTIALPQSTWMTSGTSFGDIGAVRDELFYNRPASSATDGWYVWIYKRP